jgi:hypothetical protein
MIDRVTIRVTADVAAALELFIADELLPKQSKQDAYRHIVRDWLTDHGYLNLPHDREDGN